MNMCIGRLFILLERGQGSKSEKHEHDYRHVDIV